VFIFGTLLERIAMAVDSRLSVIRGALIYNLLGYAFFILFLIAYPLGFISFYDEFSLGAVSGGLIIVGVYFSAVGGSLAFLLSIRINRLWIIIAICLGAGYLAATLSLQHAMEYMSVFVEIPVLRYVVGGVGAVVTTLWTFGVFGAFIRP
jgi:hypothetical protein